MHNVGRCWRLQSVVGAIILFLALVVSHNPQAQTFAIQRGGVITPWMRLTSDATVYGSLNTAVGSPIQVRVTDQNGNVLRDPAGSPVRLPINFRIVEIPSGATGQRLTPGDATSITVLTNTNGYASATLALGNKTGVYRVAISETSTWYAIDWVRALTPGVTASLTFVRVDITTRTANSVDVSTVTVSARDYLNNPVTGAQIFLGTAVARDHKQTFSTIERSNGLYTRGITSTVAGKLRLTAWDAVTNVRGQTTISPPFAAGPTVRVNLYAVDGPGVTQPNEWALAFAIAVDAFGNLVGPPSSSIRFTTDFGTIAATGTTGNEWTAWIYSSAAGTANVTATDRVTSLSSTRAIVFPGSSAPAAPGPAPANIPWKNHKIKFWKPKGANVDNLIAGEISGKRIVYGVKSPMLGGPAIYITYSVNEYDFSKADKNGDGILEEFKDPKKPTNEEKNLLKNCAADVENVFIVPGMSDNSYGEAVGGSVVINQGAKAPPGTKPPVPDGKTLAHENTHYWGLNAGDHTEGGKALPPENIGAADPSKASLKCTNKDILSRDQLDKLRAVFKQGGASQPLASGSGKAANESSGPYQVYPGSTGNEIGFAFTNYTTTRVPFAPMSGLRAEVVHSSPTFVLNFFPTSITLTPSSLAPGATATATFAFDVTASAVVGTGCFVELAVKSNTGDAFYFVAPLEAVAPPTAARRWELY